MTNTCSLYERYPWLRTVTTVEAYVNPEYYNKLLKDYVFLRKSDLVYFEDFLKTAHETNQIHALELGAGTGRATNVFLGTFKNLQTHLRLVDLSASMLAYTKERFKTCPNIEYVESDSIAFLEQDRAVYDVIFSLWSLSHSVHQILTKDGLAKGGRRVRAALRKMIKENMRTGSCFYLIHFDSLSEEQRILLQQWKKVFPIFSNTDQQSPSKLLIDEVLRELEDEKVLAVSCEHLTGEGIVYNDEDEALEVFINFHMESYFNESPLLPTVLEELRTYFHQYKRKDGSLLIKPGCFIYIVKKQ